MEKDQQAQKDLERLQSQFHDMIAGSHDGGVSKKELKKHFRKMKIKIEPAVFEKIYELMDADKDGTIDENEFCVTMCYFLHHGIGSNDKIELAYKLFDTNHDGDISKREFSDMISTVIGNRVETILAIQKGRDIFHKYITSELSQELLIFYEEMMQVKEECKESGIPIGKAQGLVENYIEVESEQQVNISDDEREAIIEAVKAAGTDGDEFVKLSTFDRAILEAKTMIENGPLMRFRQKIKEEPYDIFAAVAWEELGKAPDDTLTLEDFKKWTSMTPGLFDFLDQVSAEVFAAINQK